MKKSRGMNLINIKAEDSVLIPCAVWSGEKAIILYLHGIESHLGWFKGMADHLQNKGLCIYAFDRRGSGLSQEEKGHIASYKILIKDIETVVDHIKKEHPNKRIYLLGVCGGGKFALGFLGKNPLSVDGLILISPAIKVKFKIPITSKLDIFFSSIFHPRKRMPTYMHDEMFTKNKKYLDYIKTDKLRLKYVTARFYKEIKSMEMSWSKKFIKQDIPILTLVAGNDQVVNNNQVAKWFHKLKSRDKTIETFSGCDHFLPFEDKAFEIGENIYRWIEQRQGREHSH